MFPKIVALLSLLAVILGTLNTAEVLAIVPAEWAPWITALAALVLALSRALVDADGNGVPDIFEAKRLTVHFDGEKIGETTIAAMQRKEARQVRHDDGERVDEEGG